MWIIGLVFIPHLCYHVYGHYCLKKNIKIFLLSLLFPLSIILAPISDAFVIWSLRPVAHIDPESRIAYDVFHHWLPYTPSLFYDLCNPMVFVYAFSILIFISISPDEADHRDTSHRHFRRINVLTTMGMAFMLRNITIAVTHIPLSRLDIDGGCLLDSSMSFQKILTKTFSMYSCGDYFYSGHTIIFTIGFISTIQLLRHNLPRTLEMLTYPLALLSTGVFLLCELSLLASQAHFTIDILMSIMICYSFYNIQSPRLIFLLDLHWIP